MLLAINGIKYKIIKKIANKWNKKYFFSHNFKLISLLYFLYHFFLRIVNYKLSTASDKVQISIRIVR